MVARTIGIFHYKNKGKTKSKLSSDYIESSRIFNAGVTRLGIIETRGGILAHYFGKTLKNKNEIVQYHPPRGKPLWTVVIV